MQEYSGPYEVDPGITTEMLKHRNSKLKEIWLKSS